MSDEWTLDPLRINGDRINNGEPVGDAWLYGRLCLDLMESGRVTQAQIDRYRSGLFFALRDAYGEEIAKRMEGDFKKRHVDAVAARRKAG